MKDLDSLIIFNTFLNVSNLFKNQAQQDTLHRIESKLDQLLMERENNENDQGNTN